jgi:hypothetical protein
MTRSVNILLNGTEGCWSLLAWGPADWEFDGFESPGERLKYSVLDHYIGNFGSSLRKSAVLLKENDNSDPLSPALVLLRQPTGRYRLPPAHQK